MNAHRLILAVTTAVSLTGCASQRGGKATETGVAPNYGQVVAQRVADAQKATSHRVRYNPVPCGCPPFEVKLGGIWQRVAFDVPPDGDEPPTLAVRKVLTDGVPGALYDVDGSLEEALATCGSGVIYVTIRPRSLKPSGNPR